MKTNMLKTGLLLAAAAILAGCGSMMNQNRTVRFTGSLYSYLNTNAAVTVDSPAAAQMTLPLKVGVAFVPAEYSSGAVGTTSIPGEMLTGDDKLSLMQQIAGQFKPCSFVKSVEIVPTTFMAANGGFNNLDQIRNTFGVNTMLLVAYDQSQYSDEGAMALSYWTIVGAYFVRGERNETKTVMEAAFFDIGSHRLLFRPMGTSVVKGSATPVNLSEQLRLDSKRGFQEAMTNLISGLKTDLDQFGKQTAK